MKKMRGVVDPITLGFILVALGAGVATSTDPAKKAQAEVAKAQIEAPQVVVNNTAQGK